MQSVSSRIWTRVTMSIPYDDNHYTITLLLPDSINGNINLNWNYDEHVCFPIVALNTLDISFVTWKSLYGVIAKGLDWTLEVSELKLQSRYCAHFHTNTLRKGMNPPYPLPAMC